MSITARPWAAGLVAALALGALAAPAHAGPQSADIIRVDLAQAGGATQNLSLPRGKSAVIELPVDARDVLVSDPKVADVALRTPRRIYVLGMGSGQTDAVFFDGMGRRILRLNVRVDADISALQETLSRVVGEHAVRVESAGENLILTGMVRSAGDSDKAERIAQKFVAKPEMVLNMLSIAGKEQVMLKVRVVEVQRTVIKQLGFDFNSLLGQLGEPQYLIGSAATFGINGSLLGGVTGGWKLDTTKQPTLVVPCAPGVNGECLGVIRDGTQASNWDTAQVTDTAGDPGFNKGESTIKAFERVGLIRTLAEPNLTAISGESAKFLAGGEFPVPVGEDITGRIIIEFKPFGVGLGFTPVVLSEGRISLRVSTEVSELTNLGSFTLESSSGGRLAIPALNVRRAETTVELPSGGALMMAGMLQSRSKQNLDKVPGLGSLPILGSLFRSRDFLNDETELAIIITPYIVEPTSPSRLQSPADGLKIADDLRTLFLGKLNNVYPAATSLASAPPAAAYQGPVGPVIE